MKSYNKNHFLKTDQIKFVFNKVLSLNNVLAIRYNVRIQPSKRIRTTREATRDRLKNVR